MTHNPYAHNDDDGKDREDALSELDDDGWCIECGDPFHYDDCGGYNPPCECGFHCRHCHEAVEGRLDPDNDWPDDEDDSPAAVSPEAPHA